MKILYGFYRADAGEIRLDGRPIQLDTPQDARRHRIGMVFQEMVQVPALTVAENIALFLPICPPSSTGRRSRRASGRRLRALRARVDPAVPVWQAVGRRAAARGDREAAPGRRARADPRRADAGPRAARDRRACSPIFTTLRRDGLRRRLHHPQAPRGPRGRRPHHGDAPGRRRAGPCRGRGERGDARLADVRRARRPSRRRARRRRRDRRRGADPRAASASACGRPGRRTGSPTST